MKTKRSKMRRFLAAAIVMMIPLVMAPALAAIDPITVDAPAGEEDFTFTQRIQVTESRPFAGIQFEVTVSNPDAIVLNSFTPSDDITGAVSVPPVNRDGLYIFGFTTGKNTYSGELDVGEIGFTYSGTEEASIYIENIKFVHFPDDGKVSAWLKEEPDYAEISVSRSTQAQVSSEIDSLQVDDGIPLNGKQGPSWSLISLLLCAAGVVLTAVLGIRRMIWQKVQKLTGQAEDGTANAAAGKVTTPAQVAMAGVLSLVGIAVFLLTQDLSGAMVPANLWTVAHAALLIMQVVSGAYTFKKGKAETVAEAAAEQGADTEI